MSSIVPSIDKVTSIGTRARFYGLAVALIGASLALARYYNADQRLAPSQVAVNVVVLGMVSVFAIEAYLRIRQLKHQADDLQAARDREAHLSARIAQHRQTLLNQISRSLVDRLDYNQMPDEIPEKIAQLFNADIVLVWTAANTKPVSFKLITQAGIPQSTVADGLATDPWYLPAFEEPAAQFNQYLVECVPATISDRLTHFCQTRRIETVAVTPIVGRSQLVGLIGVFYRRHTVLSTDLAAEMQTVANLVASAIQAEELYRDLIQAQKTETIGSLASGIAHDFNNVLAAILACATYVKQRTPRQTDIFRYLEATESSAHRGAALTKQLLSFARRDGPRLTVFNPNDIIEQTLQILSRSFDKAILFQRHLAADLRPVEADPSQVEQVILNLAVNARDAMSEGGIFSIDSRNITLDSRNPHRPSFPLPDGDYAMLSFRDTGCGMNAATMQKIFQPFFTTKQPGKGTGLGLSMVQSIVKSFGGHIHVQSAPGKGTQFDVLLPATTKSLTAAAVANTAQVRGGSETILIAEDEEIIREMAKISLESVGYKVITAPDGAAAVTAYRDNWRTIKLVIADMVMPRMSGPELLAALREINPHVRVIVSSGFSHDQEGQRMLQHGCLAYLQKPYTPDTLCHIARQVLDSGL